MVVFNLGTRRRMLSSGDWVLYANRTGGTLDCLELEQWEDGVLETTVFLKLGDSSDMLHEAPPDDILKLLKDFLG